jgi:hypothetical protein
VSEGTATPQGSLSTLEFVHPVAELLAGEPNQLSFSRGPGTGALYYTAHLSVFRPVEDAEPMARGLSVERRYFAYDGRCGSLEDPCARTETARAGDDLLVRISLIVPADQYYVVVEDPFPAGMEPVGASLLIARLRRRRPGVGTSRLGLMVVHPDTGGRRSRPCSPTTCRPTWYQYRLRRSSPASTASCAPGRRISPRSAGRAKEDCSRFHKPIGQLTGPSAGSTTA